MKVWLEMEAKRPIRVRIAPSPTGDPHVGTAYVALFNYAFAKSNKGQFILRIEDTDRLRSTKESESAILAALSWLGIHWDEGPDIGGPYGPYRQSERLAIYQEFAARLLHNGWAYRCICSPERLNELRSRQQILKQPSRYDGHCRHEDPAVIDKAIKEGTPYVIRLKTPSSGDMVMQDVLRGTIIISCTEVDDQVLMKSDGFPTYHLANVVDDHLMGISHVIRGEEWISSLPKHLLLYEAFGLTPPVFCHLPLLRNADKSKVSKRKNPVSLNYFREAGYVPEALINFLGLMAYSMEDKSEMFSLDQFIAHFKLERISLGGPVFDLKKLLWLNGRYLREKYNNSELVSYLQNQLFSTEYLSQIVPLVKERVEKSEDFIEYADFFFKGDVLLDADQYLVGDKTPAESAQLIELMLEKLEKLIDFKADNINEVLKSFMAEHNLPPKSVFMPLRMMVCGKKASPPLFETMAVLGKERCRTRIRAAINALRAS
ncbi:MAG TPA: glutamate--tRNA ligase [Myxococcota bacterium]|nr:glutamate--tRNA ligase [Myxococcota bacterium]